MKYIMLFALLMGGMFMLQGKNVSDFTMTSITGQAVPLAQYQGKVLLIVNTASKCGFTPQYQGLEELYNTYGPDKFVILGFPANNFLKQEPGTNEEIATFCQLNYGVSFPMFAKISVKGKDIDPLYAYLTDKSAHEFGGHISWNFTKFLIDTKGNIIGRFSPGTKPLSDEIVNAVKAAIQ